MDDFRRLFARYWLILAIALVVGGGVGLAYSLSQSRTYTATSSLNLQDLSQIQGVIGPAPNSNNVPAQLAAVTMRAVKSDAVLGEALRVVPYERTIKALRDDISPSIDPGSDLVLITAQSSKRDQAVAIANAVAEATAAQANARMRTSFAADAQTLQQKLATIPNTPANKTVRQQDQNNLARLQTLSIVAEPVQIAQQADIPTASTSRRVVFNTLLGAVIGLIVGLGIAFGREALDRTVHSPDDISRNLELPIVGHVDEQMLGQAPLLTAQDTPAAKSAAARFGIIRRGVELLGGEGSPHTVLVTSPGPEEGKTTVALSLACAYAAAGRRTLLLEADLRKPSLAGHLNVNGTVNGLAEHLHAHAPEDAGQLIQTVQLPSSNGAPGATLDAALAGASSDRSAEMLASKRFADTLQELAARHDVVVIDGPPLVPVADALEIMPLVDAYVVCLRAGKTRIAQLNATKRILERLPERPGGAVVTGVAKGRYQLEGYDGYYRETA